MDSKSFGDLIEEKLSAFKKDVENSFVQFQATIRSEIENDVSSSLKPIEKRLIEIEKAQQFQVEKSASLGGPGKKPSLCNRTAGHNNGTS